MSSAKNQEWSNGGKHTKKEKCNKDETSTVDVYDGTSVQIPAGTVNSNPTVVVQLIGVDTNPVNGSAEGQRNIGESRKVSIEGNPSLQHPVIIDIPYDDADDNGIVDGTSIRETSIVPYWFDTMAGEWKRVLDYEVHAKANFVRVKTYHLTEFDLFGSVTSLTADFDGDGVCDYGCYDAVGYYGQSPGSWYFMTTKNGFLTKTFGYGGTVPVVGDFDGDGTCDYGCYDAAGNYGQPPGSWYLMQSTAGFTTKTFGYAGTVPVGGTVTQ